jgi:hypothetical protein
MNYSRSYSLPRNSQLTSSVTSLLVNGGGIYAVRREAIMLNDAD